MNEMRSFVNKVKNWFSNITWLNFAIISFVFTFISFGILISELGFYLDDWPNIYAMRLHGLAGLQQYYAYDGRPFGYWVLALVFPILGYQPLGWHIALLLLRWLSSVLMWLTFTKVWPDHKTQVTWASLLFAVYPLFAQQSSAVMFMPHWVCYLLYFLSIWLMVLAFQKRGTLWFWPLLILSTALDIVSLFTFEYFLGVELLRPVILWLLVSQDGEKIRWRIWRTALYWLPFILTFSGFIGWRLWLTTQPIGRNTPAMLLNFFSAPLSTGIKLLEYALKDFNQIVLSVWYKTYEPTQIEFNAPSDLVAWILAGAALLIALFYVFRMIKPAPAVSQGSPERTSRPWYPSAFVLGALGVLLGALPAWMIGSTVSNTYGLWNDRFGLASMFGAAIFIVAFLEWLFKDSYKKRAIFFCLLIALSTNANFRNANDYRWSNTWQTRFFYQLYWRAPYIESPTALYSDNEFFTKMGVYPTSYALNLLYPNQQQMPNMDYWFYTLYKYYPHAIPQLVNGMEIYQGHWYSRFAAWSQNALTVYFSGKDSTCLWVLTENDRSYPDIFSENLINALPATNLSRIQAQGTAGYPPMDIFGPEPEHNWCYYFEKADLARQYQQWDEVIRLYEEATAKGLKTNTAFELMPFIEGYAHSGNFETAIQISDKAFTYKERMSDYFCDNWQRIFRDLPASVEADQALKIVSENYRCGP